MRLAIFAVLALVGCSRGFSSETDETDRHPPPAHARVAPPAHPVHSEEANGMHEGVRPPPDVRPAAGAPTAGGLAWTAEAPFEATTPDTPMRAAQYVFRGNANDGDATLSVFHFPGMGGTVDDNVDRWLGQMTGADGHPLTREGHVHEQTVNELPVARVDATGTLAQGMPGMEQGPPLANQRIVGAIVTGPGGLVFFKLTGPAATVEHAMPAFDALVATVHPL